MNRIEKISAKFSGLPFCSAGDFIRIDPHRIMTHDNSHAVMKKFRGISKRILKPEQIIMTCDHDIQNPKSTVKYKEMQEFANEHGIRFYPPKRGIGHQIMIEQGHALPNTLTVASDSHSNMYGGIGCLGTPLVRTDAAAIWATGSTWWQVPEVVKVEFTGSLAAGVTGKDVIITLCSVFNKDQVLNSAVEFCGDGIGELSIDDRLAISNMTTEWGALAGVFPVDQKCKSWIRQQSNTNFDKASYAKHFTLDLSSVSPYVSGPDSVKIASSAHELENDKVKIQKAYLVSCTNSRLSDLEQAAQILKGKKIASHVKMYVAAASSIVQEHAEKSGVWKTITDAGAFVLPSGCGPCIGLGLGLLEEGETGISASNRNYKGRMGSPKAHCYLASPAVVAQSAINGYISGLSDSVTKPSYTVKDAQEKKEVKSDAVQRVPGFTSKISGEIMFCDADNLNTDAIYPGKYTYADLSQSDMAKVVMENYDTNFSKKLNSSVLVSGYNFGSGSSREQAATALLYRGVNIVICGSFSQTFKRNSMNNGLLVLECPSLVSYLRNTYKNQIAEKSRNTGLFTDIDLLNGSLKIGDQTFKISKVGQVAQELIVNGGLEGVVQKKLSQ